jgi:hypothetical protein
VAPPPPLSDLPDLNDEDEVEAEHRFDPRPLDESSPARIIATMVGIVGILLLGSLFWSALGALFGALGTLPQSLPAARPAPVLVVTAVAATAPPALSVNAQPTPTVSAAVATPAPTSEATATAQPTPRPTVVPTAEAGGRAPWILLPQPAPGTQVSPGQVTLEARGRGDAAIKEIRLELDGAPLPVSLEQRGDSIWRGFASARVSAGQHNVRAVVVDENGRSGSFRWSFDAGP